MTPREWHVRMREAAVSVRERLAATQERNDELMGKLLAEEREWARKSSLPTRPRAGQAVESGPPSVRSRVQGRGSACFMTARSSSKSTGLTR